MRAIKYLFYIIVLCTFFTKSNCYCSDDCTNFMTCSAKYISARVNDTVFIELGFTNYSNDTAYIEASLLQEQLVPDSLLPRNYFIFIDREIIDSLRALGIDTERYEVFKCLNKYVTNKAISLFGYYDNRNKRLRDHRYDRSNGLFDFSINRFEERPFKSVISDGFFDHCKGGSYFYVLPKKSLKIVLAFDDIDVHEKWKKEMTFIFDYVYDINVIKQIEPRFPCPYRQCAVKVFFSGEIPKN